MIARSRKTEFNRDLRASWQRTALLAVLLTLGLYFWIPPLYRAVVGTTAANPRMPADWQDSSRAPLETELSIQPQDSAQQRNGSSHDFTWENADDIMQTDPLVRSAEVAAIQSESFRIDENQIAPPNVFAKETTNKSTASSRANGANHQNETEVLMLKSTIVGVSRRAAYINRKLYFEGSEVRVAGETYLLKAVFPKRVVLASGERLFELTVGDRQQPTDDEHE